MLTFTSNVYPLTPHFYIVKMGLIGIYKYYTIIDYCAIGYDVDTNIDRGDSRGQYWYSMVDSKSIIVLLYFKCFSIAK